MFLLAWPCSRVLQLQSRVCSCFTVKMSEPFTMPHCIFCNVLIRGMSILRKFPLQFIVKLMHIGQYFLHDYVISIRFSVVWECHLASKESHLMFLWHSVFQNCFFYFPGTVLVMNFSFQLDLCDNVSDSVVVKHFVCLHQYLKNIWRYSSVAGSFVW